MFYEKRLAIPKNTTQALPATETLEVHPGRVQKVSVFFPPGCAGLAHLQVLYWEHIVFPSNPNGDFSGDGTLIEFPEDMELVDPPFEFTMVGWNEDDTYPHTVTLRVQVQPFGDTLAAVLGRALFPPPGPQQKPPPELR